MKMSEFNKNWKYPYKNGKYRCLNDSKYIKARDNFFEGHNGWWWGDGWWNGKDITRAEKTRKRRRKRRIYEKCEIG